jgi:hypothetical protein
MSNFLALLPLSLDAGSPREADPPVVPTTPPAAPTPAPLPEAWLESPKTPELARAFAAKLLLALVLAVGFAVVTDYFTPPASQVTAAHDSACPAPTQ